jgi:hypothetical protein
MALGGAEVGRFRWNNTGHRLNEGGKILCRLAGVTNTIFFLTMVLYAGNYCKDEDLQAI